MADVVEAVDSVSVVAELPPLSVANVSVVEVGVGVVELVASDPEEVETTWDDRESVGEVVEVNWVWALAGSPTETTALTAKKRTTKPTASRKRSRENEVRRIYPTYQGVYPLRDVVSFLITKTDQSYSQEPATTHQ